MDRHPTVAIARRSLSLSKTYLILSIAIAANGLLFPQLGSILSRDVVPPRSGVADFQGSVPLLSIPLLTISVQTIAIPVVLLYVYDRNTGVLERFLSLGMSQSDVYRRYLKASMLLSLSFLSLVLAAHIGASLLLKTRATIIFETSVLLVVLSISVVALVGMSMMAFSSLQRQRVGANQPVGLAIGGLAVIPDYIIPFIFPRVTAVLVELAIALAIASAAVALLFLSKRLISREKLLP